MWSVGSQESFEIAPFTVPRRDGDELAAERFNGRTSDGSYQQQRMAGLCLMMYESQQWDSGPQQLQPGPYRAVPHLPTGARIRSRGMVHREEGRLPRRWPDFEAVLE